jgi:hypothetical protein
MCTDPSVGSAPPMTAIVTMLTQRRNVSANDCVLPIPSANVDATVERTAEPETPADSPVVEIAELSPDPAHSPFLSIPTNQHRRASSVPVNHNVSDALIPTSIAYPPWWNRRSRSSSDLRSHPPSISTFNRMQAQQQQLPSPAAQFQVVEDTDPFTWNTQDGTLAHQTSDVSQPPVVVGPFAFHQQASRLCSCVFRPS